MHCAGAGTISTWQVMAYKIRELLESVFLLIDTFWIFGSCKYYFESHVWDAVGFATSFCFDAVYFHCGMFICIK